MDKILVPLDGKSTAERELILAGQLLGDVGTLVLLRVPIVPDALSDDPLVSRTAEWQSRLQKATAEAEAYLATTAEQWQAQHPQHQCQTEVVVGDPRDLIPDVAARENVDLTIMATEGRARFGQWLLGGVAEQAVRHACCPILLWRDEAVLDDIVVALDGSSFAEQVLPFVMQVATAVDARVTLLQVVADDTAVAEAEAYLTQLTAVWQNKSHLSQPIQHEILIGSAPALFIIDYLTTREVNLLALATHGMSGTLAGMYGSVAEKLVRNVDSSMLILRPNTAETV